jgi:hypothetical protein
MIVKLGLSQQRNNNLRVLCNALNALSVGSLTLCGKRNIFQTKQKAVARAWKFLNNYYTRLQIGASGAFG